MNVYEMLLPIGIVGTFGWVVRTFVVNRRMTNMVRMQAELQGRLLDKFGTSQEMLAYLASPAGERFVQSATLEKGNPHGRILGSLQSGIILTLLGAAMLLLRGQLDIEGVHGLTFVGGLGMALGIGFLASSFVAYRLSQAWGLMAAPGAEGAARERS
jgi:hypothetical protein